MNAPEVYQQSILSKVSEWKEDDEKAEEYTPTPFDVKCMEFEDSISKDFQIVGKMLSVVEGSLVAIYTYVDKKSLNRKISPAELSTIQFPAKG